MFLDQLFIYFKYPRPQSSVEKSKKPQQNKKKPAYCKILQIVGQKPLLAFLTLRQSIKDKSPEHLHAGKATTVPSEKAASACLLHRNAQLLTAFQVSHVQSHQNTHEISPL